MYIYIYLYLCICIYICTHRGRTDPIDLDAARGLMYTDAAHLVADQFAEAAGSDADDECV